jgi:hypothetical protein
VNFLIKANAGAKQLRDLFKYLVVCVTVCRPLQVETNIEMVD